MHTLSTLRSYYVLPPSMRFAPPSLPTRNAHGLGQATGFPVPGQFIPTKTKHWNKLLNRADPTPYTPDTPLAYHETWDVSWSAHRSRDSAVGFGIAAPVPAGVPLAASAAMRKAFNASIGDDMHVEKLDRYSVHPTHMFIAAGLADEGVAAYVDRKTRLWGSWEVYMVTGIVVARGAATARSTAGGSQISAAVGVGMPGVAEVAPHVALGQEQGTTMTAGRMSDFVWAIQVARVYKSVGRQDWDWETLWDTKGSGLTFAAHGLDQAKQRLERSRKESEDIGMKEARVFGLESGEEVFVVIADDYLPDDDRDDDLLQH